MLETVLAMSRYSARVNEEYLWNIGYGPCEVWPEIIIFPGAVQSAQMIGFCCRRCDIMCVEPFHELIADRRILHARLWEIQYSEQGPTYGQRPVVLRLEL